MKRKPVGANRKVVDVAKLFVLKDGAISPSEVERVLEPRGLLGLWHQWFAGQTGPIIDGKFYVYASDMQRFLEGKDDAEWP